MLDFNLNQPFFPSNISTPRQNIPGSPYGFKSLSKQLFGSPNFKNNPDLQGNGPNLGPSPRNQLGVPTNKIYDNKFKLSSYYNSPLPNGNFVRGNQFGVSYPYKISKPIFFKTESNEVKNIVRANSPFYPYPNFRNRFNNKYWTYPHPKEYLQQQPIYNYPYTEEEGVSEGKYNFHPINAYEKLYEGFENKNKNMNGFFIAILLGILAFYVLKKY